MGDIPEKDLTVSERLSVKLKQAEEAEGYMIAVWTVKDGFLQYHRVTKHFPIDEMKGALNQIKADLEKEQHESALPHGT